MRERIIEYHINRLKDKNADVRLKAIQELRLLKAIEALDALREVYETDINADVKRAAQLAGRALYNLQREQAGHNTESEASNF